MERYLYFRSTATAADDDDATNGSRLYPVSSFKGMCMGTAAATGIITADEDAFSMFFQPMAIPTGVKGEDSTAGALDGDACDIVIVAITTDNNAKVVMKAVCDAMVAHPHSTVVDIFDGVDATKIHSHIEGITVLHADYNY